MLTDTKHAHFFQYSLLLGKPIRAYTTDKGAGNFSYTVGDNEEAVTQNLNTLQVVLGAKRLALASQTHGTEWEEIDEDSAFESADCDILLTCRKNIALVIRHVDCQAALLYDPRAHALCALHAGWRGQIQGIYSKAVHLMQRLYDSRPQDLLVTISPSLSPSAAQFINYKNELPQTFWVYRKDNDLFDLWKAAGDELFSLGVAHVEFANRCTFSNNNYFSFRRDPKVGRHATAAVLL